jgi:hypothetical protein
MVTNLIIAATLIGLIYGYFRKRSPHPGDALFAAAILTFSSVILVTIGYSGFCDILSYLAIFSMWRWRRNIWLFTLFFAVGLFNHENILFLVPWLIALRLLKAESRTRNLMVTLLGLGIVIVLYVLFRNWVASHQEVGLSFSYYMQPLVNDPFYWMRRSVQHYWLGLFTVFKVFWIIPFTACYLMWKEGRRHESVLMIMPVFLASCQLVIAYDSTRVFTLGFMTMVLALEYLFDIDKGRFREWLPGLLAINLFVPQLYTASDVIQIMRSTPMNLLRMWLGNKPWWP